MKIIKDGFLPQNREHKITCSTCKCEFEFKQHEAKEIFDQRDGNFLQITCHMLWAAMHQVSALTLPDRKDRA